MRRLRQIGPFRVSRESFIPEMRRGRACRESFVPHMRCEGCAGRVLYRKLGRAARAGRDLFRRGTFRVFSCRASATHRHPSLALGSLRCAPCQWWWGFCSIRSWLSACCRRVAPLMLQFPPLGGGAAVVCSGVAPTSQTTSVKNTENGLLVAKWSAFWAQRCLAWCVGRT